MNKGKLGSVLVALVIIVTLICGFVCVEKVPNGYVGVQYSMNGGIKDEVLTQGWHLVSPTIKIKEFTVANEQLVLDGSDAFKVSTSDDASIAISFQMTYKFNEEDLTETYKKFRGLDGESIVNNRVATVLRSKISEVTSDYTMMDIYSGNRSEINKKVTEHLNKEFVNQFGIEVIDATIIDVHPDAQLQQTIDARVTALQNKQKAEAEQETAKVEAATKLIQAQNEADIAIAKAKGEAEANRVLSESITPNLIAMKEAEARVQHGWITVQGASTVVTQ